MNFDDMLSLNESEVVVKNEVVVSSGDKSQSESIGIYDIIIIIR